MARGSSGRPLAALPKAHLHVHLEAAMRPETLVEMAAAQGMTVPAIGAYGSFAAFSGVYELATQVLQTEQDWARLADEVAADAAAEGVVYLEPAFWPGRYRARFGSDRAIWDMVLELFEQAATRHGVVLRWMSAIDRVVDDPAAAMAVAELAAELAPRGVVSFGLHNDEVGHPPTDFVAPFAVAREAGLAATPHAGELDEGRHVRDAVLHLGATRIGHGIRAREVDGLVAELAERGTCLDVCPTSNLLLGIVPSLAGHPLGALLDAGVTCTLNADDPLLFSTTVLGEYEVARSALGFDDDRLAALAANSIRASAALPPAAVTTALAGVEAWLASPVDAV